MGFCGPCARDQEAYFAIGELVTREAARGLRGKPLAEALKRLRGERGGGSVAEGRPEPERRSEPEGRSEPPG